MPTSTKQRSYEGFGLGSPKNQSGQRESDVLKQLTAETFLQPEAQDGAPQAGRVPFAIGVIKTAKVLPFTGTKFSDGGSKEIPEPVKEVPVGEFVVIAVHPDVLPPVGHGFELPFLEYQAHWYAPDPEGF